MGTSFLRFLNTGTFHHRSDLSRDAAKAQIFWFDPYPCIDGMQICLAGIPQ